MEIHDDELYHWGIFGMKWGVRRYQNPDGTLTPEGRKRYRKSAKEMTDEELISAINRLANEKRYTDLVKSMEPEHRNRTQQFVASIRNVAKTAQPVLAPFGKAYTYGMEKVLTNTVDKFFTSEEDKQIKKLEKQVKKLDLEDIVANKDQVRELANLTRSVSIDDAKYALDHLSDRQEDRAYATASNIWKNAATVEEKRDYTNRARKGAIGRNDGTSSFFDNKYEKGAPKEQSYTIKDLENMAADKGVDLDALLKQLGLK